MSWGGPPPGQNPYYGQQPPGGPAGGYGQGAGYQQQRPPGYGASAPPAGYAGGPPPGNAPPAGYAGHPPGGAPGYGAPPPGGYAGGAPPPGQYGGAPGYGVPPPGQQAYGQYRPPGGAPPPMGGGYASAPPGGFGPPPGVSPELWSMFQAVDQDRSGQINATELQQALHNGNWTPFNAETCRLMIGMFDRDKTGTIDVNEFAALWKYIQDWKNCFERFDTDRSGNINTSELQNAFSTFGYNLSPQFCQLCVRVFDKRSLQTMNFDDFIQCCVMLRSLTDAFRSKDAQQKGVIQIQYEEFLRMVLDNSVVGKP